jgi:UDP-N-acetylmuramyl tripeptide synthase
MNRRTYVTAIGKFTRKIAKLKGGSGSALPGLIVEKIDRNFVSDSLKQLPHGTIVVSGSNGKTTTTKIIVSLLESVGLSVFTNKSGSNFTRGIAASLLEDVDINGNLNKDIAVIELDEAYAAKFVDSFKPDFSVLLNVMRDQLDRFGEIDKTAQFLKKVAENTKSSVILNNDDERIRVIADYIKARPVFFGLSQKLTHFFPSDDDLHSDNEHIPNKNNDIAVRLEEFKSNNAVFTINDTRYSTRLELKGIYNILNSAAALATVTTIVKNPDIEKLLTALSKVTPAFGRGESINVDGQSIELILVKNPSGFQLSLESFKPDNYDTIIAINDDYADGRDVSWLWDVDFNILQKYSVYAACGSRAFDMSLRLQYNNVTVSITDVDIDKTITDSIKKSKKSKRIFCTYTAMLAIRKQLGKMTKIKEITE